MRPSQKQNRARGRGGRKPNGNVVNRVFESAGPEGKVRGTPQQIIDKYLTLARDAQTSGDRVMSENFLQHAEHYQRILLEAQGYRDERRDQRGQDPDGAEGDGRDDSGDEEGAEAMGGQPRERQRHEEHASGGRSGRESREEPRRESEVSGLTTIDSGSGDGDSLLVEAEDLSASQPPRRRRNQRRDRTAEQPQESEADAQTE